MRDFINLYLSPLDVITSLLLTFPVLWTWYEIVWGKRRRQLQWLREIRSAPGVRMAVLIIDLKQDTDIRPQVAQYIASKPELAAIPVERHFSVSRLQSLAPDDMADLAKDLRKRAGEIALSGCDTVHCFYAGPVAGAVLLGAIFANGARCLLYQYGNGKYNNWGPLRHDSL